MSVGNVNVTQALQKVENLLAHDKSLSPAARALMELLVTIIQLLLAKLGLNSANSHIPPSQDPRRQRGSKRPKEGKRPPGGQNGHPGTTLEPVPNPDRIEPIAIDRRTLPPGQYQNAGYEARQVIDIIITPYIVEYRAEILQDAWGRRFVAGFPPGVTRPVQYGSGVKAQSVYQSQRQLIPYERVRDYFWDQCGMAISPGSIFNFNREAFILLEPFEAFLVRKLIEQLLLHADETGIHIGKTLHWVHVLSNDRWTYLFPHAKRGAEAMRAMGVLPHFHGHLCHDHFDAYFQFPCQHSLCNGHHVRELARAWEQDGQRWALQMQLLLLDINSRTHTAGGCLDDATAQQFRRRYRSILTRGGKECPLVLPASGSPNGRRPAQSKSRNLLDRLRDFETETLQFMTDPLVPFTNNQAERDFRMSKVQQKISGCFRSFEGAHIFCRNRSYISTCGKQGISPAEALRALFEGGLPEIIARLE